MQETGSYRVGLRGSPVAVTLVANPSTNPSVQCCEMRFPGTFVQLPPGRIMVLASGPR